MVLLAVAVSFWPQQAPAALSTLAQRALEVRSGEPGAKLRVLHLGDSHVAAEPFSAGLRDLLARLAGGGDGGSGLFFPGLPYNATRGRGVDLRLSSGWTKVYGTAPEPGETGLCGGYVEARHPGATLTLDGRFTQLRLHLLRQPGGGAVWIRVDGRAVGRVDLRGGFADHSVFRWSGPPSTRLAVETTGEGPVRVLGVALENERPGLVYSPAGVVGAQANVLLRCREETFVRQLESERPDLVILAFGTNEARETAFDRAAYLATLEAVVRRIRRAVPSATVFIAGPPDQTRRTPSGALREVAALPVVVATQREAARRTGALFLDLREAMGGPGTARRWAAAAPLLAQPDHVHYTADGYARLARLVAAPVVDALERDRRDVASLPPSRLADSARQPFVLPEAGLAPARSPRRPPVRLDETSHGREQTGGLRSYRDASGRLVVTNSEVSVPRGAPELGQKGALRR